MKQSNSRTMKQSKNLLFENDDFVVVNKPPGLLSIPDRFDNNLPSLAKNLERQYGKIFVVHRLDKDTSGVILFAKNEQSHRYFSGLFQNRKVDKIYLGLVTGKMWEKEGRIETPILDHPGKGGKMKTGKKSSASGKASGSKGKTALTTFEVLQSFDLYTLLKLQIFTGRTHQIRVHLQSIGHPIAMDDLYGSNRPFYLSMIKRNYRIGKYQEEEKPMMSRMALHASELHFIDGKGQKHAFNAPLPKDFQAVLKQLRKLSSEG